MPTPDPIVPGRRPKPELTPAAKEAALERVSDLTFRIMGGVLVLVSGVLAKFFIYDVIEAAKLHAGKVSVDDELIVLTGLLPAMGLLMMTFGRGLEPYIRINRADMTAKHVALIIAFLIPGIALKLWLEMKLRELGYGER